METFLTKTSQKKITMLHFLLERDQWCSIEELQNELGVSAKSVLNYLSEMEELFQQYHGKIVLKNEGNKRFFLEKHENFPIYTIYLHFYRSSYNYQLIDYMYKNPEKNLEAYAKEQFTSVSTVFRYAKLLVKYFARYQMLFHPYQLTIEAEESSIRSFYYYFYWNSARSGDWPFQTSQREIADYLNCFEAIYEVRLDPLQKRSFSYWLVITIERSRFFKVTINEDQKSVIREDPYFSFINQWLKASSLDFDISESYFLYQVIYSFGIIDGNQKYENSHGDVHRRRNSTMFRALMNLKITVEEEFGYLLDTEDPELVFNFIAFHERSALFFGNTDLFFNRSYVKEMREETPQVYQRIEQFKKRLISTADKQVSILLKNWEQLFLDYYYILDYYDLLLNAQKPVKILIQDDLHHTHRLWLMNKIHAYFGKSYLLAFYDYQTKIEEVDLVISNYYLDTKDKPLLLMKNIPTERNWRQLEALLYRITTERV